MTEQNQEYPDSWVSLDGGEVSGGSEGDIFGNEFIEGDSSHPDSLAEVSKPLSGITVMNVDDLVINDKLQIADCCVLCANESITISSGAIIDGRGMGGEGGEAFTIDADFQKTISVTESNNIYDKNSRPEWTMAQNRSRDGVINPRNDQVNQSSMTDETTTNDTRYQEDHLRGNPIESLVRDLPDEVSGRLADMHRPAGESGMFGENDWFEVSDNPPHEWLEQLYLLTFAKEKTNIEFHEQLLGGRGGEGGVVSGPQLKGSLRDQIKDYFERWAEYENDGDQEDDPIEIEDYNGGNGGAALLLVAPKVIVEEGAMINLQGENPTPPAKDVGMVVPERGKAGRFGVISKDYNIYSGAIKTNATVTPAAIGGLGED